MYGWFWDNHLPQVAHNRGISPGMLSIQTHCAILKHDQVKRLVKPSRGKKNLHLAFYLCIQHSLHTWSLIPKIRTKTAHEFFHLHWIWTDEYLMTSWPVIAFSMKQRFSIVVQGAHRVIRLITLLCVIQCDKESSLLHCIQRLLVLPPTEELSAGLCPRHSAKRFRKMQTRSKFYIHNINAYTSLEQLRPFFSQFFLIVCLSFL